MAYLGKGKKQDLIVLADELHIRIEANFKVIDIKDAILKSPTYDEDFTKELFSTIISERKEGEERVAAEKERELLAIEKEKERIFKEKELLAAEKEKELLAAEKEKERLFELEKLKLQGSMSSPNPVSTASTVDTDLPKLELKKLIPSFNAKTDDMSLFLNLFEKQLTFVKVPISKWVVYLIGLLPSDIAKLVAQEADADAQDYEHIKQILLKRFKMSAEKFRQHFAQHRRSPDNTWRDYYFDLRNFFEGWLAELKVTTFDQLKNLIIADQIKKKTPPEYKEHFLDHWSEWIEPNALADKLDAYEEMKAMTPRNVAPQFKKKEFPKIRPREEPRNNNFNLQKVKTFQPRNENKSESRPQISCYGCGKVGVIRSKCPTCSPPEKLETTEVSSAQFHSCSIPEVQPMLMKITINGMNGIVCADTGASHTIAGEELYHLLKEKGTEFEKTTLNITLADGLRKDTDLYKTQVDIGLEGRLIRTDLFVLPTAVNNRTLLGLDFLRKARIVLDVSNHYWFFNDYPRRKFAFVKDSISRTPEVQTICLRDNEGKHLSKEQRTELDELLDKFSDVFKPGEGATPKIQHYINTGDNPPVSLPPYRLSPEKKEVLKKEIDELLTNGTIEECESPYASPVVLVPKPNGKMRLCIDYRKLNAVTVTDNYPLPRIDDLLHEAKHTSYMSTIDLRSGYHQIAVNPADRDKTAFICPFGTYRYLRMPYGLKNGPATFQRLIDKFRNSVKGVILLSYIDDLIILSETFEKHLSDLKAVFEKLQEFKLYANREKCNFACNRVKYLGHYITESGLEVNPEKTAAIQKMPPPKTVKQVQAFLQTCSWYRRFISNFSEIARPLSNLTKKNASWTWGVEEEKAFQTLKQLLVNPPILRQNDPTQPYTLRTDASNYAIGAVLLQGTGPEEHPIEYASRLLTSAEKNYSTTEREALAIVWALKKFRPYIEGQEITVTTDHQPLRWLMNLKSPTGRLARWALEVQSFNLKLEYIPGKTNVVADMLSRPFCQHTEGTCEICTVNIDLPACNSQDIRNEQMKDENLKKIIDSLENEIKDENFANFSERGYLMNQGVLYRYSPESESEEAQLVVPVHEREKVLKEYHDAPTAGHYGSEGTYSRIAKRYHWIGMRRYITDYVKNCAECCRYKPSNQKPSGLLQTPIYAQRFETISLDFFGPLPETKDGKKWIFILEDCSTKWVELFALTNATAKECAITLIEEVFMRYGLPRRVISDNGSPFISAVMQQVCYLLKIKQTLTPVYHPQANPVERKNRDLKPRLAILVGDDHSTWSEKLPTIRFALNTAKCDSTGQTAAYLQFGRELRTVDDITHDLRSIVNNDNFVPEITPYLKQFANFTKQIKERVEESQDKHKLYADKNRKPSPQFKKGDKVWVTLHSVSQAKKGITSKFLPRRDGPYLIMNQRSPTSYTISANDDPSTPVGNYHVSALVPYHGPDSSPVAPIRRRGRPRKFGIQKRPDPLATVITRDNPYHQKFVSRQRKVCPSLPRRIQPPRSCNLPSEDGSGRLRGRL